MLNVEGKKRMSQQEENHKRIDAVGGTYITGNVNTGGGDFVGRDKIVMPDPGVAALRQVGAAPGDFTGREGELAELCEAAARGQAVVIVRGLGGVGKTTLAQALVGRMRERYADAQLFVDLHGSRKGEALTVEAALAQVIRAFYPTARLPEGRGELEGLYRSVLSGKKAVVVLDDAADAAQVAGLLPPEGCLLVVTSRRHFGLPGMKALNLEELGEGEAMELVGKIAGRLGEEERRAVTRACGRLPLALRVVASLLERRGDLGVGELLGRMRDAEKRLEVSGVEAALQTSYELLPAELQERWRMLAVFAGSFERRAAAAVWVEDEETTSDALGELLGYSLVGYGDGRYRLHELGRDFAGVKLGEDRSVRFRHARYYVQILWSANDLYKQGGDGVINGLRLYDMEVENILAGQAWVAGMVTDDEWATRLCDAYPIAGAYVLDLRLHPREQVAWSQAGVKAAHWSGERMHEGTHQGHLGNAYLNLGEVWRAVESYQQLLDMAREIGDRQGEGNALGNLGRACLNLGEAHQAILYFEQALAISQEIGDRRGEAADLGNLGAAYGILGDMQRAIGCCQQQLEIAHEIGDRQREATALGNLGLAYAELGEILRAIEYYQQALLIDREIGDRRGEANALGNLGIAYANLGQTQRAIEHYQQAVNIRREIGDRRGEGVDLDNLGMTYKDLGDIQQAIACYQQALMIDRQVMHTRAQAFVLWHLALAEDVAGERERAIALAEEALRLGEQVEGMDVEMVRKGLAEWRGARGGAEGGSV